MTYRVCLNNAVCFKITIFSCQTNILHLNKDNTLTDYKDLKDDETQEDIVQDYKKKTKNRPVS